MVHGLFTGMTVYTTRRGRSKSKNHLQRKSLLINKLILLVNTKITKKLWNGPRLVTQDYFHYRSL